MRKIHQNLAHPCATRVERIIVAFTYKRLKLAHRKRKAVTTEVITGGCFLQMGKSGKGDTGGKQPQRISAARQPRISRRVTRRTDRNANPHNTPICPGAILTQATTTTGALFLRKPERKPDWETNSRKVLGSVVSKL